jgi:MOSC domain-containing protein YiiM
MVEKAEVLENFGLQNDRHAKPDSSRQVLLVEKETLDALSLYPGQIKENITTTGISLMKLAKGSRLKIGEEVVLEITKPCSPCARMKEIRPGLLRDITGRRGMLARVIGGGTIRQGDSVQCVDEI